MAVAGTVSEFHFCADGRSEFVFLMFLNLLSVVPNVLESDTALPVSAASSPQIAAAVFSSKSRIFNQMRLCWVLA